MTSAGAASTVAVLVVALVVACLVAASIGQLRVPLDEVLGSVLHRLGIDGLLPPPSAPRADAALWEVRFPRVVLAVLVGVALGTRRGAHAGRVRQPPGRAVRDRRLLRCRRRRVRWSSCSASPSLGSWTAPIAAFVGGLLTTLLVYALARSGGRTEVVTLVLVGIAVTAFAGAAIGMLTFVAERRRPACHRLLEPGQPGAGDVGGRRSPSLPFVVVGVGVAL